MKESRLTPGGFWKGGWEGIRRGGGREEGLCLQEARSHSDGAEVTTEQDHVPFKQVLTRVNEEEEDLFKLKDLC